METGKKVDSPTRDEFESDGKEILMYFPILRAGRLETFPILTSNFGLLNFELYNKS